ncbi:MAG: glycosyltransferase [Rhizobiales bacterium]|nr:glycosyltransferase [Hyphomicrobiales bacterium]
MVDGLNLSLEKGTGIATYARNLTFALKDLGHEVDMLYGLRLPSPKHQAAREMTFFDPAGRQPCWIDHYERTRFAATWWRARTAKPVPRTGMVIETNFRSRMPRFDRLFNVDGLYTNAAGLHRYLGLTTTVQFGGIGPDVAHWTCPLPIRAKGMRNIYTIHDLVPMRLPFTTLDINYRFVQLVEQIAATADHIVTISETSKRDIINLLGVPEEKVTNTYQAVYIPDAYLQKPQNLVADEVKGMFGLDYKRYILFFGAIEPKKNLGRLIQGYMASGLEEPLVIVGEEAWLAAPELRFLLGDHGDHLSRLVQSGDTTRVQRDVRRFGYAPFPVLVSLIRGAAAVAAPSLYEGFGLPALEAMLCGTPVITSKEGASPEIAGDGALLVDPYDPSDIRDALRAAVHNRELAGDLMEKGKRRAAYFSQERYRESLAALYAKLG